MNNTLRVSKFTIFFVIASGPLSAAIYLSDCEVTKLESFIRDWSSTLSSRNNIGYHLVFKQDSVSIYYLFKKQIYNSITI